MPRLIALALLLAAPAHAFPILRDEESRAASRYQGIYAGVGGGYGLELTQENVGAWDVEARLGYSFNPGMQVFLSGSLDLARIANARAPLAAQNRTLRNVQIGVNVQYHLHASESVGFYARAMLGLGVVGPIPEVVTQDLTGLGFATGGGLGLEIRIAPGAFLGPELFYRHVGVTATDRAGLQHALVADNIGLQLNLVYY